MSDSALVLGLTLLGLFVLYESRFPILFLKYNANLLASFLSSWLMHDVLDSGALLDGIQISHAAIDYASFFLVNVIGILFLQTRSLILQIVFALFQLEVSRIFIIGSPPDIYEFMNSGAYLFVLSAAASVFAAQVLCQVQVARA
jgi:hypothetical protein